MWILRPPHLPNISCNIQLVLLMESQQKLCHSHLRKYFYRPMIHLSDEQFKKVMGMIQALKIVSESDYAQRRDCLSAILDVLFYEFKNCTGDELETIGFAIFRDGLTVSLVLL